MQKNEFASLPLFMSCVTLWASAPLQSPTTTNSNDYEDMTKMLVMIKQNILHMNEGTQHVNEKLDRINAKIHCKNSHETNSYAKCGAKQCNLSFIIDKISRQFVFIKCRTVFSE